MKSTAEASTPTDTPWACRAAPVALALVLAGFIAVGHDGRRALQMAALALPLMLMFFVRLEHGVEQRVRRLIVIP